MEVDPNKLRKSLLSLLKDLKNNDENLHEFVRLDGFGENDVLNIFHYLCEKILQTDYTEAIARCFPEYLLLFLTKALPLDDSKPIINENLHHEKFVAISKLCKISPDVLRYAATYFTTSKQAPFDDIDSLDHVPEKKKKSDQSTSITELELVKCCYNYLTTDTTFFLNLWNWWSFIEKYRNKGDHLQQLYYNHIVSIVTSMSHKHLHRLNENIPEEILIQFDNETAKRIEFIKHDISSVSSEMLKLKFSSDIITYVEGVFLPIFNKTSAQFYRETDGSHDSIVKVQSTQQNLRSLGLGISSGKAICLAGPVGSGKTTLVEYLARQTGRLPPKQMEYERYLNDKSQAKAPLKERERNSETRNILTTHDKKSQKRKSTTDFDDILSTFDYEKLKMRNGFLRVQLGDQTDSKMLLGQYRCTDVPGEFVWLPGVLTQAVLSGYWLLLEDLDSATQETCTVISNLLENNFLSVPGFRDCIRIEPGFQLFVTIRSQKSYHSSQKSGYSLLEKYFYTINILPLSRTELRQVIAVNYPKLKTIANRIVDVFLTFSSGDHSVEDENSECDNYTILPHDESISLTTLPNSGRLVSTRDLIKLCERSNPMFSITSAECAYFVFQNAVDLFCSHLPQGKIKTKLVCSIGAKMGIIQSRCEHFADEYRPEVSVDNERIKVGRAQLNTKSENGKRGLYDEDDVDTMRVTKKFRTDSSSVLSTSHRRETQQSTFSFTRLASCLLERIAVGVTQNEPILLVGETGVGKTSSVQYLAEKTNHKLVVVNMNNQSDVSDLIGGFKPVDLSYVMAPLRSEFEHLFRATFNENKNEKFLSHVSVCFNRGDFSILVKLMIKITDTVFQRKASNDFVGGRGEKLISKWGNLQMKLMKLNAQLRDSINISFAFIPGSLVNCIRNGDWVLLDEINLASAETLECLSTILEPDGSVVLLEKGDLTPIKRHPDFRIFACMNPSTDIGKKDLPVGIRNRFTEFFVDELTTESDLMVLISDYLRNTGIMKVKVLNIVKLYRKLKALSELELNDGLGNRPVFSLRTLCRALTICAKNLCGSVERNLFESFCLSFLTQLDPESHLRVLNMITNAMITNSKAVLSQQIPKPSNAGCEYLNFEGYWIQTGEKELLECANYILTESVRQNLKDLARIISIGKLPILLQGPTSAGKTSLIEFIAKKSGNYCLRINNHEHTDLQEYIGTYTSDTTGKLAFKEGVLVQAMRSGYWIILDELNLAPSDILEALNRVLDDNRELFIPETQTCVRAHPNFMLFATQNPPGLYGGRKTLSRAFKNRFIELHFSDIPRNELEVILEKRCLIPKSYAQKMVRCMSELKVNRKTTTKNTFTLRDLFRWGNRYTNADPKLLENNAYDWNQHLIDEGYLVLSSKVRTDIENEIILEALYNNFRKKISLENLYSLHENTSPVTKEMLKSLRQHTKRKDIIWTRNMTRMAVLTAKALQFDEPVLLVGPTGCGKTTVCQILASIRNTKLRILNCHMHTEGADFIGGLRPCRSEAKTTENGDTRRQLFEWSDGSLVTCMLEGNYFMADEISLAEDSVLERLNCVLEPERTLLMAEKGGVISNISKKSEELLIKANAGFQFLATMNPGGDFGKKELSPALRNRFTEIWCKPSDDEEDMIAIVANAFKTKGTHRIPISANKIATVLIKTVIFIQKRVDKFKFSIRDILAWADYIMRNAMNLEITENIIFGLETIFLDALEMLPTDESLESLESVKRNILEFTIEKMASDLDQPTFSVKSICARKGNMVQILDDSQFGIHPFFIDFKIESAEKQTSSFFFDAPTTKRNLFRLLSALSLQKAILLEGPPGVGKTSIVENLARSVGYKIVRINLCEHTDLADLFGTDLPDKDDSEQVQAADKKSSRLGSFVWRDGPLLAALKSKNTWILLDELNLAPQSVLEGLNAILDHRGEIFIPELNKTFHLGEQTRIFASQNPLRQGGGRKGLPLSFLNRFTKVYLQKLSREDLLFVINGKYEQFFMKLGVNLSKPLIDALPYLKHENLFDIYNEGKLNFVENRDSAEHQKFKFDLAKRLVTFSEILDKGISDLEFGLRGGPYEINLRDILRWCELLEDSNTGFSLEKCNEKSWECFQKTFSNFLLVLYERMKLVYYNRMRSDTDRAFIRNTFATVFQCNAEILNRLSEDIGLYWTDTHVFLNDIILTKNIHTADTTCLSSVLRKPKSSPIILSCQKELLKNIAECVYMKKPVILAGPSDCGKTKAIDAICAVSKRFCNVDNIDDSVMGSYQQVDLNRHLEEIAEELETISTATIQKLLLDSRQPISDGTANRIDSLFKLWREFAALTSLEKVSNTTASSEELMLFKNRLYNLNLIFVNLLTFNLVNKNHRSRLQALLNNLSNMITNSESLNTGGRFEWIDSKIVKSLKVGQFICLEHVNFCSSAVLDRLNPVFEPDGKLMISEKGILAGEDAEIVESHSKFRAFLTIDPKNGELSRAMRNRCIEISIDKESYTQDDLKRIVYVNGVRDLVVIKILLKIHQCMKELTELNTFNVSHLVKTTFLVESNQRLGLSDIEAIRLSAMEVYVQSSHSDLLGFGLKYYQQKLKEIVDEHCDEFEDMVIEDSSVEHIQHLESVVIKCDNLTKYSMVKLQVEPLRILMQEGDKSRGCQSLANLFTEFANLSIENDFNFIKSLIYLLYEMSSVEDLSLREKYLREIYEKSKKLSKLDFDCLSKLNSRFAQEIRNTEFVRSYEELSYLPWNRSMFPRIRHYINKVSNPSQELRLSLYLQSILLIEEIYVDKHLKPMKELSFIEYSSAISTGILGDIFKNDFIGNLCPFLKSLHDTINTKIQIADINREQSMNLMISFLWINRLYKFSQQLLFDGKYLNENYLDKLLLHFKWLDKNTIRYLNSLLPADRKSLKYFDGILQKLSNYSLAVAHPLNLTRKLYFKLMINFLPLYENEQINRFDLERRLSNVTNPIPAIGIWDKNTLAKKIEAITSDEIQLLRVNLLCKQTPEVLQFLDHFNPSTVKHISESISEKLKKKITNFLEFLEHEKNSTITKPVLNVENLQEALQKVENIFVENDPSLEAPCPPVQELSNLLIQGALFQEYFANRLLTKMIENDSRELQINETFIDETITLNNSARTLFNLINSPSYKAYEEMWSSMTDDIMETENDSEKFKSILESLTVENYRSLSTLGRLVIYLHQIQSLNSLCSKGGLQILQKQNVSAEQIYQGPPLANACISLLFDNYGNRKTVSLGQLDVWKKTLRDISQTLWSNSALVSKCFDQESANLQLSSWYTKKLLLEVEYIEKNCANVENEDFSDFNEDFQKLKSKLSQTLLSTVDLNASNNAKDDSNEKLKKLIASSMLNSLAGAIELCVFTYTPLIDPVEKNRLKKLYIEEDTKCLEKLIAAYDCMKIVMDYKNFGEEIYAEYKKKVILLQQKMEKFSKKVAYRPENCLYKNLIQDLNHFLMTNSRPSALLSLIRSVEDQITESNPNYLTNADEVLKRLNLWIVNSQRFLHHTLEKYAKYYRDFVQPFEVAITMVRFGFEGLKVALEQKRNSLFQPITGQYCNINENENCCKRIINIIEFPSTKTLDVFPIETNGNFLKDKEKTFTVLDVIEDKKYAKFLLLKSKIFEILNCASISNEITGQSFLEFRNVLSILNQIWQTEEENRQKRVLEEDSLYVQRTRCETQNEDELELQEIEENFPTYVEEDFGEFVNEETLEKIIKVKPVQKNGKVFDIMRDEDVVFVGKNFISIMERFARVYYYQPNKDLRNSIDFLTPYKYRIDVFIKIMNSVKSSLNSWIDDYLYQSFAFIIALQQSDLTEIRITDDKETQHNFYRDSNITEIVNCTKVLHTIEERVLVQLKLYPDHATLIDIIRVIEKIRSLPAVAPVVRFNTGFQILRQKIAQWNEVAHKNNHMQDLESQVAEYVQRWTRLELQFWRQCIAQTYGKVESSVYKYWFFIYNLLHEYLEDREMGGDLTDFRQTEKRFEDPTYQGTEGKLSKISLREIIGILRQFIESSNYADFSIRLRMLRSFELYLHYLEIESIDRKEKLIAVLHNLQIYFAQFTLQVEESMKSMRQPIESKLKELVKIESYNKDLSYFSMRSNVARVHRNLNKFLKEYENFLRQKISPVFQKRDTLSDECSFAGANEKGVNLRYEPKIKSYMMDIKNFIAFPRLKKTLDHKINNENLILLNKAEKLFMTSRNVVKSALQATEYSTLIYNLDSLLSEQIETCDYLRKLEVDRSQEKPKQKSQAKHILTQKRKALSDLYKTLTKLGLSFRTGLLEASITGDLTDYTIQPFCIKNMLIISRQRKLDHNLFILNENLDSYYAKSIFKLKMLQNILLTPIPELGPVNLDRMKGFAVNLFELIQNQRISLSTSVKNIFDLRKKITDIKDLSACANTAIDAEPDKVLDFEMLEMVKNNFKLILCKIQFVMEQFRLLLKCAPEISNENSSILLNSKIFAKDSPKYTQTTEIVTKIQNKVREMISDLSKLNDTTFLSFLALTDFKKNLQSTIEYIQNLRNLFAIQTEIYDPIARPLSDLLEEIEKMKTQVIVAEPQLNRERNFENIDTELENIIHGVLLSFQIIFKKHCKNVDLKKHIKTTPTKPIDEDEREIRESHLLKEIHESLHEDVKTLNMGHVLQKLDNILLSVKYTSGCKEKMLYAKKLECIVPILEQFNLVGDYYLFQQLGAHKVATKMLSIMLTVFIELGTKGFCIPPDLMQDMEEGEGQKNEKKGEGFGLEDGTGENDISDKIESEDQLDDAKKPEDRQKENEKENENCKEEKGIDMSEDFDANMQDIEKEEGSDKEKSDDENDEEDPDKQMGETEEGAEKLDDQIWGSDEEPENSEDEEEQNEEDGKGSKEEDDQHNDLSSKNNNEKGKDEQEDGGLDAANEDDPTGNENKKQDKDIDQMNDDGEETEDQINPYHNELEEPPEPEEMDLGDMNVDEENDKGDAENDENPFDIDKMKEDMEVIEDDDNDDQGKSGDEGDKNDETQENSSASEDDEPEVGTNLKKDETQPEEEQIEEENNGDEEDDRPQQIPGEIDSKEDEKESEKDETVEEDSESKDKKSREDNVQSVPEEKNTKGSEDNVQNADERDNKQDDKMDVQDTGEEKEGVGQADNEDTDKGHKGIAETKENYSAESHKDEKEIKEKRKQGNTNEERTLGDAEKEKVKQLKTVDKLNERNDDNQQNGEEEQEQQVAEEYQHVKEAKKNDKTTLDNATEDQSKKLENNEEDKENQEAEDVEENTELAEKDENEDNIDNEEIPGMEAEKIDDKSKKPSKSDKTKEKCETVEKMDIEGETVETHSVPRGAETTAHFLKDILTDSAAPKETDFAETLELRKKYQEEVFAKKQIHPQSEDYEWWLQISSKMQPNARELCEQLRLILEPTKCTRLRGDYRTGRRINMKKIIPYIASQFRKDKIWLRRTKPAQRDYKITIAIDDSKSMHHNNSKNLTLEAISLVSQALTLLESGKLSIASFGESPKIILHHSEQFDGPRLVKSLNFEQNQSNIGQLLDFVRTADNEDGSSSSDNGLFENLVLVLSDGRNIFSEGEATVRNSIKLARLRRIFLVYIIIDNPENTHSILDIRIPKFSADRKSIEMKSYLDNFPFPYYVIVRDLGQLPIVLSEAMRQWFELVNSE